MSLTVAGWESYVRNVKRQLAEIDKLDEELGDVCREARDAGREMLLSRLAKAKASLAELEADES